MVNRRLRGLRVLAATLLALLLLPAVACGGAAPATSAPTVTTAPAATQPEAAAQTPTPAGAQAATPTTRPTSAQPTASRLTDRRLHVAITPLTQETYLPWMMTSDGFLPYRPMMEHLTTIDPQTGVMKTYPQLATEWEMSPDARTYTFKLREGVPFHFGWGEFTARDFINALDHTALTESLTGCTSTFRTFMGADSATEMMEQGNLVVIDDYTLTMHITRPQVDLADWWFSIQRASCAPIWSVAQLEAEGNAGLEARPAGTGPYQFTQRVLKEYTEMERVPYDHWRVNPEFKTLRITTTPEDLTRLAMLLTGEADIVDIPKVLHDQAINEGMVVLESTLPTVGLTIMMLGQYYVSQVNWNPDQDPWAAPGETGIMVREAMNRAINRDQIINVLFKGLGEPMYNLTYHETLEGWNPEWKDQFEEKYGYDPERARQLLDQAGFPGQGGQNRFTVEVYQSSLPGLPETIEVAQAVAQSLQAIGIDARLVETEFARAIDLFRDRHDAHFILPLRQTLRPITQNMLIYYYTGPINPETGLPGQGSLYIEDPLFEEVYEKLLVETDTNERDRLARMAGDKIYNEYRNIPIVNIKATLVANPDVVEEYVFGSITGVVSHLEYAKAVH